MKIITTLLLILCCFNIFSQTAEVHLQNGIAKHNQQDYKGAIKDYEKAIKVNPNYKEAYFNRGTCALAMRNFKLAMSDFDKTIELDPKFIKAYYNRTITFVSQGQYLEALPDIDKTIELDATYPNALSLRGQIRAHNGDKKGACEDFAAAKQNGDKKADEYLNQFCGNEQLPGESLMLNWPENENWKIGSSQENGQTVMLQLIHADETLENWTEIGTMMSIIGAKNIPMDKAMNQMFEQAKLNAPKAKLTFIEKDESAKYPWIIFTIESPNFKNDKRPESQLWYIIQGKDALYSNFRAIKQATISEELKEKWVKFFKTGQIIYK